MGDAFEAFHGALALRAAFGGVVLVAAWRLARRSHDGGRLGWVAAMAAALAWREHVWAGPLALTAGLVAPVTSVGIRLPDSPLVGPLSAISMIGVWAAVPDTEPALIAAAVTVVAVAAGPVRAARVGDRLAALGMVGLAAWTGSAGRSELVGGLACAGLLLAPTPAEPAATTTLAVHVAVVLVASRVLTRWSWAAGGVGAGALLVVSWGWWAWSSGRSRRDAEHA